MGVDYDGVGGIGVEFAGEFAELAIKNNIFTEEEWDEDQHECLEKIGMPFQQAGNSYSGEEIWYLFVEGNTLGEINANADRLIHRLANFGVAMAVDDLKVIEDIHIW